MEKNISPESLQKNTIKYDGHSGELLTLHSHQPRPIARKQSSNIRL